MCCCYVWLWIVHPKMNNNHSDGFSQKYQGAQLFSTLIMKYFFSRKSADVTLDHKTNHKGQFSEIEIYTYTWKMNKQVFPWYIYIFYQIIAYLVSIRDIFKNILKYFIVIIVLFTKTFHFSYIFYSLHNFMQVNVYLLAFLLHFGLLKLYSFD